MEKLRMRTAPSPVELLAILRDTCPQCVVETVGTEGGPKLAVDVDALRAALGESALPEWQERYQMLWPGKLQAAQQVGAPVCETLRPDREKSVNFATTENLYIEGDNLQVLKILQEAYLGQVKLIYIDPPYNTGKDFLYSDRWSTAGDVYAGMSGDYDAEGNRLFQNTTANGRYHSDWLNMIYPRLLVARTLLRQDGAIFISIDDHEAHNLRKVCDEVFGERNFIAQINWKGRGGRQDSKHYAIIHEYILCYARNAAEFVAGNEAVEKASYNYYDEEKQRHYKRQLLRKWGSNSRREDRPNLYYPITAPDGSDVYPMIYDRKPSLGAENTQILEKFGCWRFGTNTMEKAIEEGRVEFVRDDYGHWIPYERVYEPREGEGRGKKFSTWIDDVGNGTPELKLLFGEAPFDYAKSSALVMRLLEMGGCEGSDLVMDFFSGSATTAQAVMTLNARDGGMRRYIMVQLPEPTPPGSEARRMGYQTIADVGRARIIKAVEQLHQQYPEARFDFGFRTLRLDSTNMADIYYLPEVLQQQMLEAENVKPDRSAEDLLFQALPECGLLLSEPVMPEEVEGAMVYNVERGRLLACFERPLTLEVIVALAKRKPAFFLTRDSALETDSMRENITQIFRQYSPDTRIRVV